MDLSWGHQRGQAAPAAPGPSESRFQGWHWHQGRPSGGGGGTREGHRGWGGHQGKCWRTWDRKDEDLQAGEWYGSTACGDRPA